MSEDKSEDKPVFKLEFSDLTGVTFGESQQNIVKRLVARAPKSDLDERIWSTESEHWKKEVFTSHREGEEKIFTLPKNIESHADNILMSSVINAIMKEGYKFALSNQEVKTFTGEAGLVTWISGYLTELYDPSKTFPSGASQFVKGRRACILEHFKPEDNDAKFMFRTANMTLGQALAKINCSSEVWGARPRLTNLFRSHKYVTLVESSELLQSNERLKEVLKISMPWKDMMVFTEAESSYLDSLCKEPLSEYEKLIDKLSEGRKSPYDLHTQYRGIRQKLKSTLDKTKQIHNMRSARLFPQGTKKATVNFRRLPLDTKVNDLRTIEYCRLFDPSKLAPPLYGLLVIPSDNDDPLLPSSAYRRSIDNTANKLADKPVLALVTQWHERAYSLAYAQADQQTIQRVNEQRRSEQDRTFEYQEG